MNHIYSTLTNDMLYTTWDKREGLNFNEINKQIFIKGGTGVATKHLVTEFGIKTEVSDEDLEHLESNPTFQLHKANGFIKILKRKVEPEKAIVDMSLQDESRPLTAERIKTINAVKDIKPASNKAI